MTGYWGNTWPPDGCPGCPYVACANCFVQANEAGMHLSKKCPHCDAYAEVTMPTEAWEAWANSAGKLLRDAWPEATLDELDIALTGTHPECFRRVFGERVAS